MSIEDNEEHTLPPADGPATQGSKGNASGSPTPEETVRIDTAGVVLNAAKKRTSKRRDAGTADRAQQTDPPAKPLRKARTAAKVADAVESSATAPSAPKRTRRRETPGQHVKQEVEQSAPQRADVPPVTEEAIAFLANTDARVPELYKLQPQSREFVLYHVANVHRLEAHIAAGRTYLATHMPKFSPEFERTADALLAKLAKSDRTRSTATKPSDDKTKVIGASHFYGPRQVTEVVQVRALDQGAVGPKDMKERQKTRSSALLSWSSASDQQSTFQSRR